MCKRYIAKLTSKYRVTVPQEIRKRLWLAIGDRVVYEILEDGTVTFSKAESILPIYRNNLKNRESGKEALQNLHAERATIAQGQGASEHAGFGEKPTLLGTDSSGYFGIDGNMEEWLSEEDEQAYRNL